MSTLKSVATSAVTAIVVHALFAVTTVAAQDTFEPDNFPLNANPIAVGEVQHHSIHTQGDVDWLYVYAESGTEIRVETFNLEGANPDTELELYDVNGGLLAEDDDGGFQSASSIDYTVTTTGFYEIKVGTSPMAGGHFDDQGGGQGTVDYDIVLGTPPIPAQVATNVTVDGPEPISVVIQSRAYADANALADWWLVADTPFGWYSYDAAGQTWVPGVVSSVQAPLVDIHEFAIPLPQLPGGSYRFYFGVDLQPNGELDIGATIFDFADVVVGP